MKLLNHPAFSSLSRVGPSLFLAMACMLVFFYRAAALPFLGPDEPRYTRIAEEMLQSRDWIIPHLEGKPWLEKPPLFYWITAFVFKILGDGEAQARLTSALALSALALAVFLFGRRWFSARAGWIGATALVSSVAATGFSRAASMDALFSSLVFVGLCFFADGTFFRREEAPWTHLEVLFSALCMGAAVMSKGLLGVLLPVGVLLFFLIWTDSWFRLSWTALVIWVLTVIAVILPWHAAAFARSGFDFLATYLVNHQIVRYFTRLHHHAQPWYYYLGIVAAGLLPWSMLIPFAFSGDKGERPDARRRNALFLLRIWVVGILGFFTMSSSKLPGYILPVFPALALLIGANLDRMATIPGGWVSIRRGFLLTLGVLSLVMGSAVPIFLAYHYSLPLSKTLPIAAAFWVGSLLVLLMIRKKNPSLEGSVSVVAGVYVLFVILLLNFCSERIGLEHSTRAVVERALSEMEGGDLLASYRFFHHTLGYYSAYRYLGNWNVAEELAEELRLHPDRSIFLVTEPRWLVEIQETVAGVEENLKIIGRFGPRVLVRLTPRKSLQ